MPIYRGFISTPDPLKERRKRQKKTEKKCGTNSCLLEGQPQWEMDKITALATSKMDGGCVSLCIYSMYVSVYVYMCVFVSVCQFKLWFKNGFLNDAQSHYLKTHTQQTVVYLQTAFLWLESLLGIIFTPLDFNSIAFFTAERKGNWGY